MVIQFSIKHVGSFEMPSLHSVKMDRVLHVPDITKNLINISQFLKDNNVVIEFYSTYCVVKDLTIQRVLLREALKDGLHQVHIDHLPSPADQHKNNIVYSCNVAPTPMFNKDYMIWHKRLGHSCHVNFSCTQIVKNSCSCFRC